MKIKYIGVPIGILFLLFAAHTVYAQTQALDTAWDFIVNGLVYVTGLPQNMFSTFPIFLYRLLLPFLLIWFIILGFLKQIRIFTRAPTWIEWFISFAMAALTVYPLAVFALMVSFIAGLSGTYATLLFFGMFILGITLYAIRWGSPQLGSARFLKDLQNDEKELRNKMNAERDKYAKKKNPGPTDEKTYLDKVNDYRKQITIIQNKRKNIANE